MMGYGMWGMGGAGWFGMVLLWILTIVAIVWLVRNLDGSRSGRNRDVDVRRDALEEDRAMAILRERYAQGEIDRDEFEDRKRDLVGRDER